MRAPHESLVADCRQSSRAVCGLGFSTVVCEWCCGAVCCCLCVVLFCVCCLLLSVLLVVVWWLGAVRLLLGEKAVTTRRTEREGRVTFVSTVAPQLRHVVHHPGSNGRTTTRACPGTHVMDGQQSTMTSRIVVARGLSKPAVSWHAFDVILCNGLFECICICLSVCAQPHM